MTGFHYINMNGDIKHVLADKAFDVNLQKQLNFFPCDINGVRVAQPEPSAHPVSVEVKKNVAAVASNPELETNNAERIAAIAEENKKEEVEIINPLAEAETVQPEQPVSVAQPKKRGRKAAHKK